MIEYGEDQSKINLQFEDEVNAQPGANIKVIGIGGGGGNAVDRMIEAGVSGVDFIVANTDAQALRRSHAPIKIHIGSKITKGLGAGAKPEVGREAALEDTNAILEQLEGADMVFVTAGLGGGTGTGAAPIIASLASELGSLVVAVVTSPFSFEGPRRRRNAESGLKELKGSVDTVITISNDKLLQTVPDDTPFTEAFRIADDVLRQAVQGISDLINVPGVINLDFADVKTIMQGMGVALMGSGNASGDTRAVEAAQNAISSPLLEEANINGARGVLLNIVGGPDLTMSEINEAASLIHQACDPDAEIIFGAVTDEKMTGSVTVTVIATGFSTPSRELRESTNDNLEFFPRGSEPGVPVAEAHSRQAQPRQASPRQAQPRQAQPRQAQPRQGPQRQGQQPRRVQQQPAAQPPGHGAAAPAKPSARPIPLHAEESQAPRKPRAEEPVGKSTEQAGGGRKPMGRKAAADARAFARPNKHQSRTKDVGREAGMADEPAAPRGGETANMLPMDSVDYPTPEATMKHVLMTPQGYGANNMGFEDDNDLDIPTYLRNMRKLKK
ncbi:cell division protein FtsZ [Acanthopleuribacter pedis]|uniref:Cell division protein FtsZ n=1 Tax=Acanthopleuribacter pedis TaxID=442870 RepID=A0A8J7Q7I5_9BACT|nr:cell division protein FtsZ [Acanthopleuribacter pedis]MBO1318759.1 cell division protein FtsZ [Acanthopleuribacter pedis]